MQANQSEIMEAETVPARVESAVPAQLASGEALLSQALAQGASIETLERLMALREKMRAEQAQQAFLEAMAGFQGDCPVIRKDAKADAGKYKYKYAPLDTIITTIQPHLKRWGLLHTIDTQQVDEGNQSYQVATCTISHIQGHSQTSTFKVPIDKHATMNDMQKAASALTYAKRYALVNAYGIVTGDEDDDGQSGGAPSPEPHQGPQRASQTASAPAQDDPKPKRDSAPSVYGLVEDVEEKNGTGSRGPWTRYGVKVKGGWYGTFDLKVGEKLKAAMVTGKKFFVYYEQDGSRRNILGVEEA